MNQKDKPTVEYEKDGTKVKEMMTTFDPQELEDKKIAENNAELVFKSKYVTIPLIIFRLGLNGNEAIILAFIHSFLDGPNDRFYFTNEQMADRFSLSIPAVSKILKRLKNKGFIKLSYKMRTHGGQIRFVKIGTDTNFKTQLKQTLSSNLNKVQGSNNNISNNKISNIYMSDKKKEIDKIHNTYKKEIQGGTRLTPKARQKIAIRLKEYSIKELIQAIRNFGGDSWWMKNNSHRGIAWFFHTQDRIEQFLNLNNKSDRSSKYDKYD